MNWARTQGLAAVMSIALTGVGVADGKKEIAEAARPLDEGVPEVAVFRLQKLAGGLRGPDALMAKEKLAEALVAAAQPAEALRVLGDASGRDSTMEKFLRAQALTQLRRHQEALPLYESVARDQGAGQRTAAAFGAAETLRELGRKNEAIRGYAAVENDARYGVPARLREAELFIDKGDPDKAAQALQATQPKAVADKREKRLLHARVELQSGRASQAIALLDSLLRKSPGAAHETIVAALFAMADAHLQMHTPESGDDYLEDFIDRHPNDPALDRLFAKLDQVYRAERKPPRNALEKWARDSAQPRRGFARWYLAQNEWRAGRQEDAFRQYEWLRNNPSPGLAPALLQYARLEIDAGRFANALGILAAAEKTQPDASERAEIDFECGRALYGTKKFAEAAARFSKINAGEIGNSALLNASLAWLEAGDATKAQASARELTTTRGDTEAAADLALEQALTAAQRGDKKAPALLEEFVQRFPSHARAPEAELALAELAFHSAPPQLDASAKYLAAANAAHPTEATMERIAYLEVWLADARGADSDTVITAANEFLRNHPQSPLASEVRMKLAESHFRRQDFANAQTQFEMLAQENPKSPLSEKALFLAAQSAAAGMGGHSLERALELLTQVVKMNGELRWAARNEQAAIERRLGKPQDAQVLYDEALKGDAGAVEKREALCGKADIFFELASVDNASLARAETLYDQLADETAGEPHWLHQALFKKGLCLEKQSDRDGALATFYRVLEFDPTPGKPPEFFWYYKAGFNAARLLEEEQKWESAAAIYEKLAAANGPRSEEARARLSQLRLEHFLWQ
jgi:outer membrane protein assembly factor BamD (BamD/ComL family)